MNNILSHNHDNPVRSYESHQSRRYHILIIIWVQHDYKMLIECKRRVPSLIADYAITIVSHAFLGPE